MALLDAGHLVTNIVTTANGLGISTMARLQMNDSTMRELIGVPADPGFAALEAVQAMVVWADGSDASKQIGWHARSHPPTAPKVAAHRAASARRRTSIRKTRSPPSTSTA